MRYDYDRFDLAALDRAHLPEWYLADGMGGYAAGSITNGLFRKHQGYLVAALNPPTDRTMFLAKTVEQLSVGGRLHDFSAGKKSTGDEREGDRYLTRFTEDEVVRYVYEADGVEIEKTIAPRYGGGAVALLYRIAAKDHDCLVRITPQFTTRNHGDVRKASELTFDLFVEGATLSLLPKAMPEHRILVSATSGAFVRCDEPYDEDVFFAFDASTGDDRTDAFYQPCRLELPVAAGSATVCEMIAAIDELPSESAATIIASYRERIQGIVAHAGMTDDFAARLVRAGDLFIAYRRSTGRKTVLAGLPWFADWGRDTMIAFEGLTLTTKRYPDAKDILASFAQYERNGLIPNMFPDAGQEPYYNTADASLWYVHAVMRYLEYTGDEPFVRSLYPTLERIIAAYCGGTSFSIGMDSDGLMRAGSGLDQVTWMDVRIDGIVVTPRHGKPVEINALWYNALCVMGSLARRFGHPSSQYDVLAKQVRLSFNRRFWNEATQCLFDVVDADDPSVRPNMLFACSLPYGLLSDARLRKVVKKATDALLDVYGLRSLSKDDPRFVPEYSGPLRKRDFSYHMGTTWGFLIGTYVDSYLKAYPSMSARLRMKELCHSFETHLREGCVGGVAEIFDGLDGRVSRGCSSQAWSVAELLRTYVKNGLDRI
ncbi:MAG TPA: glycogen debranching protein [Acholeplasmatales bacterium]|nr:glycogen debranching protein [Acholeplasmatales bacterium]